MLGVRQPDVPPGQFEYKTGFAPRQTKRRPEDDQKRSPPAESSKRIPVVMDSESATVNGLGRRSQRQKT
jgi:hypothetical protein